MSYAKAGELLALALDIASRRYGMTMAEIDRRWDGDPKPDAARRRTQRVLYELRSQFPAAYDEETAPEGKTVRLRTNRPADLSVLDAKDVAALERGVRAARDRGEPGDAERLEKVLGLVRTMLPEKGRTRTETDLDALLQSRYLAARQGPQPLNDRSVIEPLSDALLAVKQVAFDYNSDKGTARRTVHPYGLLTGIRTYLVALAANKPGGAPTLWRLDRMANVEMLAAPSLRPDDFSLASYAERAFGVFQRDAEYGEVEWRFAPEAAANARGFRFHSSQRFEANPDGSLTVRFRASGHLEMAWFLYQWGDKVEVVAPAALRDLVAAHRRSDFAAMP